MQKEKAIVYIGDFDFTNENVQSYLVKNNGKILNKLGYKVIYIGINRDNDSLITTGGCEQVIFNNNFYLELPNTLNIKGVFKYNDIKKQILVYLNKNLEKYIIEYVITYQAPTYALILKEIINWCKINNIKYIVNCADLPSFKLQPVIRRIIMNINWKYMHYINKKYSDGIIAVSNYIRKFYEKERCPSLTLPPLFDAKEYLLGDTTRGEVATFVYAGCPFALGNHVVNPAGMKDRLDYIIDLFSELTKMKIRYNLIVIGIDKENYLTCVPRQKQLLMYNHEINFLGKLSHSETIKFVAESDFTINYRDKNKMTEAGMSTKIIESISVGTPVVINDTSDTFCYLEEGVSGFQLNKTDKDISKLNYLCQLSTEDRKKLKKNCYNLKLFDVESYIERVDVFLKSL